MHPFWSVPALVVVLSLGAGETVLCPPDGFREVWRITGPAQSFVGAGLYNHIDGGAETFLELGFEAVTVQSYRRAEAEEFTLELYRMTDADAALGTYLVQCGPETPDPDLAVRHTVGRYQLALVKGRYYVLVTSTLGQAELVPELVAFGRFVAQSIPAVEPSRALDRLPPAGLVKNSQRIIRGPFGLQAIATLGKGDVLLLGGKVTAVAADYRDEDGATRTLILADYATAEQAAAAFRYLGARLDPLLERVASSDTRLVFLDRAGRHGLVTLDAARLTLELGLERPATPPSGSP